MLAASKEEESGLGFVDSRQDQLTVSLEIFPPSPFTCEQDEQSATLYKSPRRRSHKPKPTKQISELVEVILSQDQSGLRSRKGDTGSVLWRASVHFARLVLTDHHYPPTAPASSLLSAFELANSHVLELGAGTGLLSIVLAPLVRRYTATDMASLTPLIRKNVRLNDVVSSNVHVEELDWAILASLRPNARPAYFRLEEPVDLLLCVDCIYNTALVKPLLAAMEYVAERGQTKVVVVVELRDEDVIREFLQEWLGEGRWEVWRVGQDFLPHSRCVAWVGWKV